jgi:hypothetical protein
LGFFQVTAYLDYTTVYNENSIHHFWDGDIDEDGGRGGHALNAGKQSYRRVLLKMAK